METKGKHMLIAYFSRSGENYVNGGISSLKTGNTEVAARMIHAITGAVMYKIETVRKYPADYRETTEVAAEEKRKQERPALATVCPDVRTFDGVFLGYPNWWGTMPMALFTFLESQDFSGKTILPFCTNEGSGMGSSEADIRKTCPDALVKKGLSIHGSEVNEQEESILRWIRNA